MSNNLKIRWIVLVNKSPRGPLTEAEVRMLLAQGVVRHNDLAYRVDVDDPKLKSDWKLIWQFEEFNRRTPDSFDGKKETPDVEKRDQVPPEEIVKQNLAELPIDLADIAPEELIPRSRAMSAAAEEAKWQPLPDDSVGNGAKTKFSIAIPSWAYGLFGVVLVSFVFFNWLSGKNVASHLTPTMPPPETANAEEHRPQPRGTASRPNRSAPVRSAPREIVPPTERPRENESAAERDLDRERQRDRDRDKERDDDDRRESEASNESASGDEGSFDGTRSTPAPGARRPSFRKKSGGILDEENSAQAPIEGDPPRTDVPLPESD